MKMIGVTGPAGSGKDTVAGYLVEYHNYTQKSFAAPLKAMLAAIGFPEPANREDKEKQIEGFPFSWRKLAQTLGTEWRDLVDRELWLKLAQQQFGPQVVFSDARFNWEAEAIRQAGGIIIHLEGRSVDLGNEAGHASEAGVTRKPEDFIITNQGTIADLYNSVESIL